MTRKTYPASDRKIRDTARMWRVYNALRAVCVRKSRRPGFTLAALDSEMAEQGAKTSEVHQYVPFLTEHQVRYSLKCLRSKGYIYLHHPMRGSAGIWWARGTLELLRREYCETIEIRRNHQSIP